MNALAPPVSTLILDRETLARDIRALPRCPQWYWS